MNLINMIKVNKGMVALKNIPKEEENGFKVMKKRGELISVAKGLYLHENYLADDFYISQFRLSKGIFSHETALYLQGLIDENISVLDMTIPSGYNSRLIKNKKYNIYYKKENIWSLGQIKVKSPLGNIVKVYEKERCIIELLNTNRVLALDVLKKELKKRKLNFLKMKKYAELFNKEEQINNYLEVLL